MKGKRCFVIRVSPQYMSLLRKEWQVNIGETGDEELIRKQLKKDREADIGEIQVLRTF